MFTPSALLQLVPNRAESILRRVQKMVWSPPEPLVVEGSTAGVEHRSLAEAENGPWKAVKPGTAWGRLYDQRWFRIALPADAAGRYLEWQDQGEATLYVEGAPYYGFDVAHRRVVLPPGVGEVWLEAYCCQSAIWHPAATGLSAKGSVFNGAALLTRDDEAWEAQNDLKALVDLMLHLRERQRPAPPPGGVQRFGPQTEVNQATPLYRRVLRLLDDAADAFDTAGVAALRSSLAGALRELRDHRATVKAVLTGHAHIDLVWLWPERMGEAKAVHTFSTMCRLMELYSEFRFAYSQPASYEAVARRTPLLALAVQEKIASGRWEATGAMHVESDTLLPCGEALARSFLLGQSAFRRLRGTPARLVWLPDVFGYSGCLPQLMRLAGVEWFFTTKLTWSAVHRFPYSSFVWRGSDGSEVVAHVTQNVGYNNHLNPGELESNANGHVQSDVHPEFLHPTGYGDGGGGVTEEMCEQAKRLDRLAGGAALSWDQPEAFFARLARRRSKLPVHQGECYLEYHRGTYTTHGDLKDAFRALERALQVREAVAVACGTQPDLAAAWRRMIFAQFHDYIPGSSVADVYIEGLPELRMLAAALRREALNELESTGGKGEEIAVFNPHARSWSGWVSAGDKPVWVTLPPVTAVALHEAAAKAPAAPTVRGRVIASDRVRAVIDARGNLRRLRIDGKEVELSRATSLRLYPDRPANYDSWDIDRHSLALGEDVRTPIEFEIDVGRPDRASIAVRRQLGRNSSIVTHYTLVAGEAVLRVEFEVDWHEQHTLLKFHCPTAYAGPVARFGVPFGSITRGQQPGSTTVEAQWEVPGSRWAAVAREGERSGLAVVTEAKYGFAARDGELTVSLLRSARFTGCDDHRYAAPPGLGRVEPASPFTDQGSHRIRLALAAYDVGDPGEIHPAALADTLFTSPLVFRGGTRPTVLRGVELAPTLHPCWVMPLPGGEWLLRLHEVAGQTGRAVVRLAEDWEAVPATLDGGADGAALRGGSRTYRPYEIVSLRLRRRRTQK